jgi:hypothetical protein
MESVLPLIFFMPTATVFFAGVFRDTMTSDGATTLQSIPQRP